MTSLTSLHDQLIQAREEERVLMEQVMQQNTAGKRVDEDEDIRVGAAMQYVTAVKELLRRKKQVVTKEFRCITVSLQTPEQTTAPQQSVTLPIKSPTTSIEYILHSACKYFRLDPAFYALFTIHSINGNDDHHLPNNKTPPISALAPTLQACDVFTTNDQNNSLLLMPLTKLRAFDPDYAIQAAAELATKPVPISTANNAEADNNSSSKSLFFDMQWLTKNPTWAAPYVNHDATRRQNLATMIRTQRRRRVLAGQTMVVIVLVVFTALCVVYYSNVNATRSRFQLLTRMLHWDASEFPTLQEYWMDKSSLIFSLATGSMVRIRQLRVQQQQQTCAEEQACDYPAYSSSTSSTTSFATTTSIIPFSINSMNTIAETTYLDRIFDSQQLIPPIYDDAGGFYLFFNRSQGHDHITTELQSLQGFIDKSTRFVAIEFNSYDANIAGISAVKIIAQYPAWTSRLSHTMVLTRTMAFDDTSNTQVSTAIVLATFAIAIALMGLLLQSGLLTCWPIRDSSLATAVEARFEGEVGIVSLAAEMLSEANTGHADLDFAGEWAWMFLFFCTTIFLVVGIAIHPRFSYNVLATCSSRYVELYDDARRHYTTEIMFGTAAFFATLSGLHTLKLTWSGSLVIGTIMRCSYLLGPIFFSFILPPGIALVLVAFIVFGPYSIVFGTSLTGAAYAVTSWNFPYPFTSLDMQAWKMAFLVMVLIWTYVVDASVFTVMLGAYMREYKLRVVSRKHERLALFGVRDFIFGPMEWLKKRCHWIDGGDDDSMNNNTRRIVLGDDDDDNVFKM